MGWKTLPGAFVRVRASRNRLEVSALDQCAVIGAVHLVFFVPFDVKVLLPAFVAVVATALTARCAFVATRDGATFERRILGVVVRKRDMGIAPTIDAGLVWDWCELAVVPRDPALRRGLHDDERAVLLEWTAPDDAGDSLARLVRSEIERLHGRHLPRGYRVQVISSARNV